MQTTWRKIAEGMTEGYKKVEDAFVNTFIAKEGETVENARARIAPEQKDN